MNKKLTVILIVMVFIVSMIGTAHAASGVVYVSEVGDDTAAGTAAAPVESLERAYAILGSAGGTVYVQGEVMVRATDGNCFAEPVHTGKITVMGISTDATLSFSGNGERHYHLGGDTEFRNLRIADDSEKGVVFSADNHVLTMGYSIEIVGDTNCVSYHGGHAYSGARVRLATYCPCGTVETVCSSAGGAVHAYSGEYWSVSAWYGGAVNVTGGTAKINLGMQGGAVTLWVRYLCPGLLGAKMDEPLTSTNATVTVTVSTGLNTAEPYVFTQNAFSGSMTVNWILKAPVEGKASALLPMNCIPDTDSVCTLNVYAEQTRTDVKNSALRLVSGTGDLYAGAHTGSGTFSGYCARYGHDIRTQSNGRLICALCGYEQCRHRTWQTTVLQAPTCKQGAFVSRRCTDLCKQDLGTRYETEKDPNNHVGIPRYGYSASSEILTMRCTACNARYRVYDTETLCDRIIVGDVDTDYTPNNPPPAAGTSPLHFATLSEAVRYATWAVRPLGEVTIEVRGALVVPNGYSTPDFAGHIRLTGGSEGGMLCFEGSTKRIRLGGDMTIENLGFCSIGSDENIVICAQNHKLVMGEGITVQDLGSVTLNGETVACTEAKLCVIGGFPGANAEGQTIDSDITIRSGDYRFIGGWNYNASTNDGKSIITIGKTNPDDTLQVEYLTPFSRGDGYITRPAEGTIVVDGDVTVTYLYVTTLNKASLGTDYITNIVLKGDIESWFDIHGCPSPFPICIVNVYTDMRVEDAIEDSFWFFRDDVIYEKDPSLDVLGAIVTMYTYEDYCATKLDGHRDLDTDGICDECGFAMNPVESTNGENESNIFTSSP